MLNLCRGSEWVGFLISVFGSGFPGCGKSAGGLLTEYVQCSIPRARDHGGLRS